MLVNMIFIIWTNWFISIESSPKPLSDKTNLNNDEHPKSYSLPKISIKNCSNVQINLQITPKD